MYIIKNKPYIGYLEKSNAVVKKRGMKGGTDKIFISDNDEFLPYFEILTKTNIQNFSPSNLVFTAGTILNDTIYIKKIILTPTVKIWLYRLMLI